MTESLTRSIQDYLKRIYELSEEGVAASTTELAARLNVAPASVTGMLQKLAAARPPLVIYKKRQGATLTKAGLRAALEVIRHHRLLETWLVQTLGYTWDEVHEEAERLEHVISKDLESRIAAALGHPTRDPHGEPIPSADLTMPADASTPLAALRPAQTATVQRVDAADPNLLRHLESIGLVPGAEIQAAAYSEFDHNLTVKIGKKSNVLGLSVTTKIFVDVRQ
ncbi:MAG: metal-dependent transcriptional regulator [Anaerolineales bacterium]|nr:MAG: metal-dependent transcriptional regulator [Anaerolineales bacterium]